MVKLNKRTQKGEQSDKAWNKTLAPGKEKSKEIKQQNKRETKLTRCEGRSNNTWVTNRQEKENGKAKQ